MMFVSAASFPTHDDIEQVTVGLALGSLSLSSFLIKHVSLILNGWQGLASFLRALTVYSFLNSPHIYAGNRQAGKKECSVVIFLVGQDTGFFKGCLC